MQKYGQIASILYPDRYFSFFNNMTSQLSYSYTSEIEIRAPKDLVWQVLSDFESYHQWNPFTPKIESSWQIGAPVSLTVRMNKDKKPIIQKEYLRTINPPNVLAWGMNWGILLHAERTQKLSTLANGNTHYFNEDVIKGLLSPIVHWIYGHSVQKGFEEVAKSLKHYIESN